MKKALILFCMIFSAGFVQAEESKIMVVGSGLANMKPDTVVINAGITTESVNAADCNKKSRAIMNAALKNIKSYGIEDKDIKSVTYSMVPQYTRGTNIMCGYKLTHIFSIRFKDTKKYGELIDSLVVAGVTNINKIVFSIEDESVYRSRARKDAVEDAKKQAEELAQSAGVKLDKIINILESNVPQNYGRICYEENASYAKSESTPIMEGQIQIESRVSITYLIK